MTLTKHTELIGKRIRMIKMDDPYPITPGTEGVIRDVDDLNQYVVLWDNGRILSVIPEVDEFEIID
jgi:RNase P/RNase MRP subunit p29